MYYLVVGLWLVPLICISVPLSFNYLACSSDESAYSQLSCSHNLDSFINLHTPPGLLVWTPSMSPLWLLEIEPRSQLCFPILSQCHPPQLCSPTLVAYPIMLIKKNPAEIVATEPHSRWQFRFIFFEWFCSGGYYSWAHKTTAFAQNCVSCTLWVGEPSTKMNLQSYLW
jgi:hypothetical protein